MGARNAGFFRFLCKTLNSCGKTLLLSLACFLLINSIVRGCDSNHSRLSEILRNGADYFMDSRLDFLYLTENEAIQAGAGDMQNCISVMEEVFHLLGQGDYLMGTPNHNAHGIKIYFPKTTPFPNMPIKGPDRRFMALVAYLGGRFNVCGEKWYGSNIANRDRGLPRSILTTLLNDPDTGAPIAFLSANCLSATRTGAIPAVGAKYCAKKDTRVLTIIGIGAVDRSCLTAFMSVLPSIQEIRVYDLNREASAAYCAELEKHYGVRAVSATCEEDAVRGADVINVVTSGAVSPKIEDDWLKEGALLSLPASADISKELMQESRILVDNWEMYEAYAQELRDMPGGFGANLSGICGFMMDMVWNGELSKENIINLGDVVCGKVVIPNDGKRTIFIMDGMPVEDVAWGYTIYKNALQMGLGTKLNLWDKE